MVAIVEANYLATICGYKIKRHEKKLFNYEQNIILQFESSLQQGLSSRNRRLVCDLEKPSLAVGKMAICCHKFIAILTICSFYSVISP